MLVAARGLRPGDAIMVGSRREAEVVGVREGVDGETVMVLAVPSSSEFNTTRKDDRK